MEFRRPRGFQLMHSAVADLAARSRRFASPRGFRMNAPPLLADHARVALLATGRLQTRRMRVLFVFRVTLRAAHSSVRRGCQRLTLIVTGCAPGRRLPLRRQG